MFSEVCVIRFTGGGSILPPPGQRPPPLWTQTPFSGGRPPGQRTPQVLTTSGGHCSGRYASNWNEFLLWNYSVISKLLFLWPKTFIRIPFEYRIERFLSESLKFEDYQIKTNWRFSILTHFRQHFKSKKVNFPLFVQNQSINQFDSQNSLFRIT